MTFDGTCSGIRQAPVASPNTHDHLKPFVVVIVQEHEDLVGVLEFCISVADRVQRFIAEASRERLDHIIAFNGEARVNRHAFRQDEAHLMISVESGFENFVFMH